MHSYITKSYRTVIYIPGSETYPRDSGTTFPRPSRANNGSSVLIHPEWGPSSSEEFAARGCSTALRQKRRLCSVVNVHPRPSPVPHGYNSFRVNPIGCKYKNETFRSRQSTRSDESLIVSLRSVGDSPRFVERVNSIVTIFPIFIHKLKTYDK